MNWNVLGGFGAGIAQGAEDWRRADEEKRRKQEFQFLQEQRQRMVEQQKADDQLRDRLKGIKQTRTENLNPVQYDDEGNALPAATREVRRTREEINRDRASIYGEAGRPELAEQYESAADAARESEWVRTVNDLIRSAPGMDLEEYAMRAAAAKTGDMTPVNARVRRDANGQLVGTIYDYKTGRYQAGPIQSHEQINDMLMSTLSPQMALAIREASRKAAETRGQIGLQGAQQGRIETMTPLEAAQATAQTQMLDAQRTTELPARVALMGAQARNTDADTGIKGLQREILIPAQAENIRADTRVKGAQAGVLIPAQAGNLNAQAQYYTQMGSKLRADMDSIESRLPDAVKAGLAFQKDMLMKQMNLAAEYPNNVQLRAQIQRGTFDLMNTYNQLGQQYARPGQENAFAGIDAYAASGIPRPEVAAQQILKDKPPRAKVEEQIQKAEQIFGPMYAQQLRATIFPPPKPAPQGVSPISGVPY